MAHYTTYRDGTPVTRSGGSNAAGAPAVTVFENTFDASRRPLVAADTVDVLDIPAGAFVHKVFVKAEVGEASQTVSIQDDAETPIVFVTAADVGTTGARVMGTTTAAGKFFPNGGKLAILVPLTKAYNTLRLKVVAEVTTIG